MDNPDGGGHNSDLAEDIRNHDRSCRSLHEVWLPRRNGKSCPTDFMKCHGPCGLYFYNEGLGFKFEECPESWHLYCTCCADKLDSCGCETTFDLKEA